LSSSFTPRDNTSRRTFLWDTSVAAAVPTAAPLLGGVPGTAAANASYGLPDYAPVPPASVGELAYHREEVGDVLLLNSAPTP
jgi:hypothetical protein